MKNSIELEQEILKLRAQKARNLEALKSDMSKAYEAFKPSSIANRIFVDLKEEPKLKNNTLQALTSLAVGYVSKRLIVGKSNTFLKSIMGYLVQIGATKIVSNQIITQTNNHNNNK